MTIGFFSYLSAVLAYGLLLVLLSTAWRGRLMGLIALVAVSGSFIWAAMGVAMTLDLGPAGRLPAIVELLRNGAWFLFLSRILLADQEQADSRPWVLAIGSVVGLSGFLILVLPGVVSALDLVVSPAISVALLGWTLQAIFALLLVEQVFRNRLPQRRWEIKHLCFGLGAVFGYDLFFYSDALLFQRIDPAFWEARGFVNAMIVPLVAVSAARNPSWSLDVHVSRQVVLHSATLSVAGLYLLTIAAAGYYVRYFGGDWGAVLQIAFLFAAAVLLLLALFSGQLRSRLRVLLSSHFFSFKYDYREEWQRFTHALSRGGVELPEAVVKALGEIVASPAGLLWLRTDNGAFELTERVDLPDPETQLQPGDHPMIAFMQRTGWLIDLDEFRTHPDLYRGLVVPEWVDKIPRAWLIIPLFFRDDLCGFVLLVRSEHIRKINWEDRSLLKNAGRQAATHVAQYLADQALMRARQFQAFNQLSAYVAHDLKNLLAQQSLLLANAEKHKHDPLFIEDVIRTIRSSVERMNRLMAQLRTGVRGQGGRPETLALHELIREGVAMHTARSPRPKLAGLQEGLLVVGDRACLLTILGHIIQNAQEATAAEGNVVVRLLQEERFAVIEVEDDGEGMSLDFVRERLFRPFDSTKGLTGMGIGAFESREMVRAMGGDIVVSSAPGKGALFRIYLPRRDLHGGTAQGATRCLEVAS